MTRRRKFVFFFFVSVTCATLSENLSYAQEENEEEEGAQNWSFSAGAKYLSRYTTYGVDMSQDQPALSFDAGMFHASGFNFGAEAISTLGSSGGYRQSSVHVGYSHSFGEKWTALGMYTYHSYQSDTLSALAGLSSSLSFGLVYHLGPVNLSASYNMYFGGGTANYLSLGATSSFEVRDLSIEASTEASFASQTVDATLLPKNRGQGKGKQQQGSQLTTTVTGMSSLGVVVTLSYPVGKGFTASLTPSYLYSPTDLSTRSSQFLWYAGLSYSVDF